MLLKIGKIWIIISIIILQTNNTYADKIPPKTIPVHENGQEFRCLDLTSFKILLKDYTELRACDKKQKLLELKIKTLEMKTKVLEMNVELHKENSIKYKQDRDRLLEKWKEENRLRHKAEQKPILGESYPWMIAGAFAISTAILSVIVIVQ